MKKFDPVEAYASLPAADQARLLTRLAWELTLVGRAYYMPGTEELADPAALRAVNELQHQITQHVLALLDDNPRRYPDDVLIRCIVDDTPDRAGLRPAVRDAFAAAYRHVRPEAPARPLTTGA
jgi:hypothetical protein